MLRTDLKPWWVLHEGIVSIVVDQMISRSLLKYDITCGRDFTVQQTTIIAMKQTAGACMSRCRHS